MTIPVLFKRHFQVAYVVDDAAKAADILGKRFGVSKWDLLDMIEIHGSGSAAQVIGNAWVGDMMIEVIEPQPGVASIYNDWKRDSGAAFRFHHLGFLIDSADEFTAAKRMLADSGFPIVVDGSFGEVLDYAYADTTAELGHYYEMIRLKAEGDTFFGRIPVN
jgi:Glyoxalase/Bleomycin resistance protein/Dioxygenase superfamily